MTDLRLINGDIEREPTFVDGPELIAQRIRIRLRTHRGEWLLDRRVGLPYLRWRGQKPPRLAVITSRVRETIRETEGVAEVRRLRAVQVGRRIEITGIVLAETGEELGLEAALFGEGNVSPTVALKLATVRSIL